MLRTTIFHWVTQYGYIGIFSLLMLGILGAPIPDEVFLTFAGYLIYKGDLKLFTTIAAAFLGSMCGITLSYVLGRTVGIYLIKKYGHIVHITVDKLDLAHNWFDRVGRWALLFGYFLPGVRHLTAYVAGTSKLQISVFGLFAYTGGFIWSVTFILLGYFLGEKWAQVSEEMHRNLMISSGVVAALLLFYFLVQQRKRKGQNL